MKYVVKKGKQRASPLLLGLRLGFNPHIKKTITFGYSIPYNLDGPPDTMEEDDFDVNKLIGFGFVNLHKLPMHHYESVRIGWLWNPEKHKVDLYAYQYSKGTRISHFLYSVKLGIPFEVEIVSSNVAFYLIIRNKYDNLTPTTEFSLTRQVCYPIAYLLGPYFGGNEKAPHNIEIFIS